MLNLSNIKFNNGFVPAPLKIGVRDLVVIDFDRESEK